MIVVVAAALRFWRLGDLPPGLYRDEAYNGLDALGVLDGRHALFFTQNNGREPGYIYLVALTLPFLGRTALALRLAAAVAGTLTTWLTYRLSSAWFDRRTGLLAAWLWAVTLWPVHLGRIGLRAALLPGMLALAGWLTLRASQQPLRRRRWLAAGLAYGASFYTYLAVRFSPLLLLVFVLYVGWQMRARAAHWPLRTAVLWFSAGLALAWLPLAILFVQHPDLLAGRSGQVSILNPAIHGGNLLETLLRHTGQALGLFFVRGDTILRHNPAGRPLFDPLMTLPFLIGLGWCLRHWRRPATMGLLLWTFGMLGPTLLAEDTPHFLRATGILPATFVVAAIGLSQLWSWPKLPDRARRGLTLLLAAGTLLWTVRDYGVYVRLADTGYLFEAAARELAEQINIDLEILPGQNVLVDGRFTSEYPSIRFLVDQLEEATQFEPANGFPFQPNPPYTIAIWPYGPLDFVADVPAQPLLIQAQYGALARGDLEPEPYPLYARYVIAPVTGAITKPAINFDNQLQLRQADVIILNDETVQVDLYWATSGTVRQDVIVFVHVTDGPAIVGQSDERPAQGLWPVAWWQPGQIIFDRRIIHLRTPYESGRHQVIVGLYEAGTIDRLPVLDSAGAPAGDFWPLTP